MEASPEVICWSNSMQWLLSHITLPNKPTLNERSLHHISKVYHLDASPSTNYILNDVQVLCWTQGCSWSATASELSGARWIISHLNLFPQLSWYPWKKHCQRHNGPEGWVLLTKVTPLGHSTKSYTNLDQTSSESRPSTNFKISTKHQHFDKTS